MPQSESSSLIVTSVVLTSEKLGFSKDIFQAVSDIQIYENLLTPFLTGRMTFLDAEEVLAQVGYAGDEYVIIELKKYNSDKPSFKKKFYLDQILNSKKAESGNSLELFVFHLIEDTRYQTGMINISKSYRGSVLEIINNIVMEYINPISNTIFVPINDQEQVDNDIRVIIPNLNPIDAITWLRKRAINDDGMPYFLYSTFSTDSVIYSLNLKDMLQASPINLGEPYKNYQSPVQYNSFTSKAQPIVNNMFQILDYQMNNSDNFYKIMSEGFVGSTFNYFDIVNGENNIIALNAEVLLANLYDKMNLKNITLYPYGSTVGGMSLSDLSNLRSFGYPSIKPHETGFSSSKSFLGENVTEQYAKRIIALTTLKYIEKNKMQITLSGETFLNNPELVSTIGNKIELQFLNPDQLRNSSNAMNAIDFKKSGEYLITKAVHNISTESYSLNLEVCKVADKMTSTSSSGGQSAEELSETFNDLDMFTGGYVA